MQKDLEKVIAEVAEDLFGQKVVIELTRPEEKFGDYATNVALQLAKSVGKNPRQVAEELVPVLQTNLADKLSAIDIAGPGFINLTLNDGSINQAMYTELSRSLKDQTIVAEYSDPNPFKVLHAGHLYTTIVGNAIANLLETAGGNVHRVNFGGDVGLHVGKAMWGILKYAGQSQVNESSAKRHIQSMLASSLDEKAAFMAARYVDGNSAYDEDETAKTEIVAINKRVYEIQASGDKDSDFAYVYRTCRQWSYDYFNLFYERLGVTAFEKYYPESETAQLGIDTVKQQLANGVYEVSDGAVIFRGEPYGLHTRVFINSAGLPTYEAKDVGLIMKKWQDYAFDTSVIVTGNDIVEYMKVVLKSIEQFQPELPPRTKHITHGQIKLAGGVKMSSRKGNFLLANDVLDAAKVASEKINAQTNDQVPNSAVKYAFLKQRTGGDIIYDPEESVSIEGNSGPYLQYAHARARSILRKAENSSSHSKLDLESNQDLPVVGDSAPSDSVPTDSSPSTAKTGLNATFDPGERSLARKISEFPEVFDKAVNELMPHYIATYLYELAQNFNRFYEHNRVVGDDRQAIRLKLVELYAQRLKTGLELLGINAPETM